MTARLTTDHEGACPSSAEAIRNDKDGLISIDPAYRKHQSNEKEAADNARLSLRLENPSGTQIEVRLAILWGKKCSPDRTFAFLQLPNQTNWRMIPGREQQDRILFDITLPPGVSKLADSPEYLTSDLETFLARIKKQGAIAADAGRSREKRPIALVRLPSTNPKKITFFLQARDHGYETAGSYFVEGALQFLLGNSDAARYLRSRFEFIVLPMTNPDGVANGMSRLTWEQGADLNRVHTVADPAHGAIKRALDAYKPSVYLNIHNWTYRFKDGMYVNDQEMLDVLQQFMPPDHARFKYWSSQTTAEACAALGVDSTPTERLSWKNYCKMHFGAIGLVLEFPWFSRTPEDMRAKGMESIQAVAMAALFLRKQQSLQGTA